MMKRSASIFFIVICSLSLIGATCFANTGDNLVELDKEYEIDSVNELKVEINELGETLTEAETVENLNEKTDPIVIKKFIIEKQKKAEEILNNSEELVLGSSQEYFEKTYDLGDYCWIKIEIEDKRIPSFLEKVKEVVIPSSYAFSQSGHKTGWQKYGNYSYTGRATANYGVAMGQYMLEVNYNVSANGIKVTDETASSIDETLLSISTQKCITTDNIATKPGASDCNSYAIFKTTYGYSPVVWTRNHKLQVNLKYLDKDATNKELHITREWSIAPYNP